MPTPTSKSQPAKRARTPAKKSPAAPSPGFHGPAQVAFILLPDLAKTEKSYAAICALHGVLRERGSPCFILSALHGAILVLPDELCPADDLRDLLPKIFSDLAALALPVKVGVACGSVRYLLDADGHGNFIGPVVNEAARLAAMGNKNPGVLFASSFYKARKNHELSEGALKLSSGSRILKGKAHDVVGFKCHTVQEPPEVASNYEEFTGAGVSKPTRAQQFPAVALALDLTKFSAGDSATTGERFGGFVAKVWEKFGSTSTYTLHYSPGGDGGIVVISGKGAWQEAKNLTRDLGDLLTDGSDARQPGANLDCRIGVHYGPVQLYKNAAGIMRPTGGVCFVADKLASGQAADVVVYSEAFKDALSGGNESRFARDWSEIAPLGLSDGEKVKRFVAASSAGTGVPSPGVKLASAKVAGTGKPSGRVLARPGGVGSPPPDPKKGGQSAGAGAKAKANTKAKRKPDEAVRLYREAFGPLVEKMQALVDQGADAALVALMSEAFAEEGKTSKGAVDVLALLARLGPPEILSRVWRWLDARRDNGLGGGGPRLVTFCAGLCLVAVECKWVIENRGKDSLPVPTDVLGSDDANLPRWLMLAISRKQFSASDLDKILCQVGANPKEIVIDDLVPGRDTTPSGIKEKLIRAIVGAVLPKLPLPASGSASYRDKLNALFNRAKAQMKADKLERHDPFLVILPPADDAEKALVQAQRLTLLNGVECLVFQQVEAEDIIPEVIRVVSLLHDIRKHGS